MWLGKKQIRELAQYLGYLERRIDLLEHLYHCLSKSIDSDIVFTRTSLLFFLQKLMEKTLGLTNDDFIRLVKYCDGITLKAEEVVALDNLWKKSKEEVI